MKAANELKQSPQSPQGPMDLARHVLLAASHFAGAAMQDFRAAHPDELEALAGQGFKFAVRIDDMLGMTPRVSLMAVGTEGEASVAHVDLQRVGGPGATAH